MTCLFGTAHPTEVRAKSITDIISLVLVFMSVFPSMFIDYYSLVLFNSQVF